MKKMKERWAAMLWYEKATFCAGILCSVGVIVLASLQLLALWEDAAYAYLPLCSLLMLIQAFENRNKSKSTAIISLCAAGIILFSWIFVIVSRGS